MLKLQLPDWAGQEGMYQLKLSDFIDELTVKGIEILASLMYYMRRDETDIFADRNEGKVLVMDNPFSQTNAEHLLKPLMDMADKMNTQLICFRGWAVNPSTEGLTTSMCSTSSPRICAAACSTFEASICAAHRRRQSPAHRLRLLDRRDWCFDKGKY